MNHVVIAAAPIERKRQKKKTLHVSVATIHGRPVAGASTASQMGTARKKLRAAQPPSERRLKP
jgi:hypothetical protein